MIPDMEEDSFEEKIPFGVFMKEMSETKFSLLFCFWKAEDPLHEGMKEMTICRICPRVQEFANVLKIMGMTELDLGFWKYLKQG